MNKKQVLRAIAFFVCVAIMVVGLCDLFEESNTENSSKRFHKFRNLPENTVDAVMIGTSGTDRYWVASQAYEKYGMTVYPMSTNSMPVFLYTNIIEEVLAHQSPELLILDIRPFTQENIDTNRMDVKARLLLDVMEPFTVNRIKAAVNTMQAIKKVEPDKSSFDLSLFFSFIKFHSRWTEDNFRFERNMGDLEHNYLGFYIGNKMIRQVKQTPTGYDPENIVDLDPISEEALYELFDYIKEKNLNVVFFDSPQVRNEIDMGRANKVYSILDEYGYDYIHFYDENDPDGITIDFDFNTDFYNSAHTNFYGAAKFTDAFSDYLHENYDLPDRRNDEAVKADWDGVQEALRLKIHEIEGTPAYETEVDMNNNQDENVVFNTYDDLPVKEPAEDAENAENVEVQ